MTMTIYASADGTYEEFQVGGVPKMRLGADTSGQPFSFRNLLINGNFNINQRAYVSGTNTVSSNQYTLDRWRIPVSGFNFTFAASGNGNLLTLPSGMSIEQVVEGANVVGGTYVINWEGTASCEIDGVPKTKGATVTLTANTNVTVEFINGTLGKAQLEAGSIATPFENRPIQVELAMCQRYYQQVRAFMGGYNGNGANISFNNALVWPPMRTTVSGTLVTEHTISNLAAGGRALTGQTANSGYASCQALATGSYVCDRTYALNAEF